MAVYTVFNFHEQLRSDLKHSKFEVGNLLFVEYKCPLEEESVRIWSAFDYVVYVLSGKKTWCTSETSWTVQAGEALYVKKGANIIRQYFEGDFCMVGFFITDDVIGAAVREAGKYGKAPARSMASAGQVVRLDPVSGLEPFYQSMLMYFRSPSVPAPGVLVLKAKELIIHLIGEGESTGLASYFHEVAKAGETSLRGVMEANFCFNLRLEDFARLSNRSLSSFKRDFSAHYGTSPGKWLLDRRLTYAAHLLAATDKTISEVAFDSGFEGLSHFSRAFRSKFRHSPTDYRSRGQRTP